MTDATTDTPLHEAEAKPAEPVFDRRMLEALVCPLTQSRLVYDAGRAELVSEPARLAFPIRDGIPIMLVDEARKLDD
ncbi:MAG: Trm112 family protein [Maritimibacter sp.]|nr:Trm112 family protein [Maritimibacter sp.]